MYDFTIDEDGDLIVTPTEPAHPETEGYFIRETDDNYGGNGPFYEISLPVEYVTPYDYFECHNGHDGKWYDAQYYRVAVADLDGAGPG